MMETEIIYNRESFQLRNKTEHLNKIHYRPPWALSAKDFDMESY